MLRRKPPIDATAQTLTLRLGYRPPYDFAALLAFLRARALPGIEAVDAGSYSRVMTGEPVGKPGWLRVSAWPGAEHALKLELGGATPGQLIGIVQKVRRMFDLDTDPRAIADALGAESRLQGMIAQRPGLRLPSGWDGFEIAVRAIVGQQVSVAAARTVAGRLVQRFGTALPAPHAPGLTHVFPTADTLADADLQAIGLTGGRSRTIGNVARAYLDGRIDFKGERTLEEFVGRWIEVPGVGPWTAHYVAMRALGHPDAFPAEDLVLRRVASNDDTSLSARALSAVAEAWRPWRAYAAIQLWNEAASAGDRRAIRDSQMLKRRSLMPARSAPD